MASTSTGTTTNIQGGDGGDTINVQAISGPTSVGLGLAGNTVNVGSMAGVGGFNFQGVLANIAAALAVNGQPLPDLFNYPVSDPASATFILPRLPAAITSVTVGGMLLPRSDFSLSGMTLTVTPPASALTGSVPVTVIVAYTVASPGFDNLVVDDSGDMQGQTGTLTSDTILGLGMSADGIVYDNVIGTLPAARPGCRHLLCGKHPHGHHQHQWRAGRRYVQRG